MDDGYRPSKDWVEAMRDTITQQKWVDGRLPPSSIALRRSPLPLLYPTSSPIDS